MYSNTHKMGCGSSSNEDKDKEQQRTTKAKDNTANTTTTTAVFSATHNRNETNNKGGESQPYDIRVRLLDENPHDKTKILAHSAIQYRIMNKETEEGRLPKEFKSFGNLHLQNWYVMLQDVTFLVKVNHIYYVSTIRKGFLSNGVTYASAFDDVDPKSWWLHDWHFNQHAMQGTGIPVVAGGGDSSQEEETKIFASPSLADPGMKVMMTLEEANGLFDIEVLRVVLDVAELAFGKGLWESVFEYPLTNEAWMEPLPGDKLVTKTIPALNMKEVVRGNEKRFVVDMSKV